MLTAWPTNVSAPHASVVKKVEREPQTIAHQRTMAEQAGFEIDEVVSDNDVSGVATRLAERDQGRRLFDMLRRGTCLSSDG